MSSSQGSWGNATERPVGYLEKPMGFWQRLPHRSDTGGAVPMLLEGKEKLMNERMRGMTPERRAWRKQWLADQVLSPREPVYVDQLYRELHHPFKRAFNWPFNQIKKFLSPYIGEKIADNVRVSLKVHFWVFAVGYFTAYMIMFNPSKWDCAYRGLGVYTRKPMIYPGESQYPFVSTMAPDDYASKGFKTSIFYKSEEQIRAEEKKKGAH